MAKRKEKNRYSGCVLFDENVCGAHKPTRTDDIYQFQHLADQPTPTPLNLKEMIESRIHRKVADTDWICSFHCKKYGESWQIPQRCLHPNHSYEAAKMKKVKGIRTATHHQYMAINASYPFSFPVLGKLCCNHRKQSDDVEPVENIDECIADEDEDVDYQCPFSSPEGAFTKDDMNSFLEISAKASPIQYILNKTPIRELSESAKRYQRKKLVRAFESFKEEYAKRAAPGQEQDFLEEFDSSKEKMNNSGEENTELSLLLDAFENAETSNQKILILSALPSEKYSREKVMEIFNCTLYMVKQARKWREESGALIPKEKKSFTRLKLNMNAARHFIEFLFTSDLLQDIAYGSNTITYSNGEKQMLPKTILTMSRSHTILSYKSYCESVKNFPLKLSDTSMFHILDAINPSQRHALAGLDDIKNSGLKAFAVLEKLIEEKLDIGRDNRKTLLSSLETGKRYLKFGFAQHCEDDAKVCTHNIHFALFDPKDKAFQPELSHVSNNTFCADCFQLLTILDTILSISSTVSSSTISAEDIQENMYDAEESISEIKSWISHLLRDRKQDEAKQYVFKNLDANTGVWLSDWAQKVLPVAYREGQKEYFGKKGMSLHVDVLFRYCEESKSLLKNVYLTAIQKTDQDVLDVLCVSQHVLLQMKRNHPDLHTLYRRSDNASCYAGNSVAELMYKVCKDQGVKLRRYDYNEPQRGKDQADRESATSKGHLRAYLNSGKDVKTAEDMRKGIFYHGSGKDTDVSVVTVNKNECSMSESVVPGISSYHSVQYSKDGMTFWQYYEVGPGKFIPYSKLTFKSGLSVVTPFQGKCPPSALNNNKKARKDRSLFTSVLCTEPGCTASFDNDVALQEHISKKNHQYSNNNASTSTDFVKSFYADLLQASSHEKVSVSKPVKEIQYGEKSSPLFQHYFNPGWAIPRRNNIRFSFKQRMLLYDQFMAGEISKSKVTPEDVVKLMRQRKNPDGSKTFASTEYLKVQQVTAAFSRMSSQYRKGTLKKPVEPKAKKTVDKVVEDEEDDDDGTDVSADSEDEGDDNIEESDDEADFELAQAVEDALQAIPSIDVAVGKFVYVGCEVTTKKGINVSHYAGQITKTSLNSADVEISFLSKSNDKFIWPDPLQVRIVDADAIHLPLDPPLMTRRDHMVFSEKDMLAMKSCCSN